MEVWHPRAERVIPTAVSFGTMITGVPWREVLHLTTSRNYSPTRANFYGAQNWPHATAAKISGVPRLFQHGPIDRSARAMQNDAGGVETNRCRAVQLEIAWGAYDPELIPDDLMNVVADWCGWVADQTGCRRDLPLAFVGSEGYGEAASQRLGNDAWLAFDAICGHQHVPENDHWDPGHFPADRLAARLTPPLNLPPVTWGPDYPEDNVRQLLIQVPVTDDDNNGTGRGYIDLRQGVQGLTETILANRVVGLTFGGGDPQAVPVGWKPSALAPPELVNVGGVARVLVPAHSVRSGAVAVYVGVAG